MNQPELVLQHMEENGGITPAEAIEEYGCYRLASVIHTLRQRGYRIKTIIKHTKNRYGKTSPYAFYKLEVES